nr:MBL fold metallo-hydrolase [Pseudoclavibacter sp. Marseille-Q3772]
MAAFNESHTPSNEPEDDAPRSPIEHSDAEPEPQLDAFGTLELHYAEVNDFENNCYVVVDTESGEALIVDAAANAPAIVRIVDTARIRADEHDRAEIHPVAILTTHGHHDHWGALAECKQHYSVPSIAGASDAAAIPVSSDRTVSDGDTIRLGSHELEVIGLRGHTPGSVALVLQSGEDAVRLIPGDSLFPGGPGKTNNEREFTQLMDDLESRVFNRFEDDTVVYPGHGKATTLGAERPQLGEWRERGW